MKLTYFIFFIAGVVFFSCKKDTIIPPPDLGYNYYPGTIKSYVVYDVDSIVYHQVRGDTAKYKFQIQEVMDTLITDNSNRPTIKLIRYRKNYSATIPYSNMTWTLQSVWVANKTNINVQVDESNIRYTKLAFPINLNATWDGTAYADTSAQTYQYTTFDSPLTLNGNAFSKTLTVRQAYGGNKIYYQNYYEQYARGVGLIYKQIINYNYPNTGVLDSGHIIGGTYYVMTVNSYGKQ